MKEFKVCREWGLNPSQKEELWVSADSEREAISIVMVYDKEFFFKEEEKDIGSCKYYITEDYSKNLKGELEQIND